MAVHSTITPARHNPTWVPATEPLGPLAPFFNRKRPSAATADPTKPKGDPWAALIAGCQPWPSLQAHAWRRRSQGWSVQDFCQESIEALTAMTQEEEFA